MSETKKTEAVICKFRLTAVRTAEGYDWDPDTKKSIPTILYDLEFVPVTGTSEENKKFWRATPSGLFKFQTISKEAAEMFLFRHEYYVIFMEKLPKELSTPTFEILKETGQGYEKL